MDALACFVGVVLVQAKQRYLGFLKPKKNRNDAEAEWIREESAFAGSNSHEVQAKIRSLYRSLLGRGVKPRRIFGGVCLLSLDHKQVPLTGLT